VIPPPAESPANIMCAGLTARCSAPVGGRIRKRSIVAVEFRQDISYYCAYMPPARPGWRKGTDTEVPVDS